MGTAKTDLLLQTIHDSDNRIDWSKVDEVLAKMKQDTMRAYEEFGDWPYKEAKNIHILEFDLFEMGINSRQIWEDLERREV